MLGKIKSSLKTKITNEKKKVVIFAEDQSPRSKKTENVEMLEKPASAPSELKPSFKNPLERILSINDKDKKEIASYAKKSRTLKASNNMQGLEFDLVIDNRATLKEVKKERFKKEI